METDYYRSQTDLLPTFSLILAASLIGLNHSAIPAPCLDDGISGDILPASAHYSYYASAEQISEPEEQVEALRHFADCLLGETEDSPQEIVDVLNQHFWDLV